MVDSLILQVHFSEEENKLNFIYNLFKKLPLNQILVKSLSNYFTGYHLP